MTDVPISRLKHVLLAALADAGNVLQRSFGKTIQISKKGPIDLVTAADRAAERHIRRRLKKHFPDHALLMEESGISGQKSRYRWIVDPLDGTTNYAHGLPHACVSIGLEKDGRMLVGGILDPFKDELFFAVRGHGATMNGKKIAVSRAKTLIESLLVTGFPYDRRGRAAYYLSFYEKLMRRTQGIRRFGAAALDMAYVACGRFDGFWEFKLKPWDVAAGWLIVEEAGGRVTDFRNRPFILQEPGQLLCSNGLLHKSLSAVLARGLRRDRV